MKRRIVIVLIGIAIIFTVGYAGYLYFEAQNDIVIRCNDLEITKGDYTMYMIHEANNLNYKDYENQEAFIKAVQENVLDRICVDAYYNAMCRTEGYYSVGADEVELDIILIAQMVMLDFDYANFSDRNAYLHYFNVTEKEFRKFYKNNQLYKKYFSAKTGQNNLEEINIKDAYNRLTDRQAAIKRYEEYRREQWRLYVSIDSFFRENRYQYARNQAEVIYLEYPVNPENGEVERSTRSAYKRKAEEISETLRWGGYYHQIKEQFAGYVKSASLVTMDHTSTLLDLYGEEFVQTILNGNEGDLFTFQLEQGIVIAKVNQIHGKEENRSNMELEIKTKEIGNKVRKAILGEAYEPVILNQDFIEGFRTPKGAIWEKLLEK